MDESDTRGSVETAQAPSEDWREVSGGGATSDRPLAVPFRGTDWNFVRGATGGGLFRNSDRQWREFVEAGRTATNMPPAGVTYQDRLFLFHVGLQPPGPSETTRVFRTNFDGSAWHPWLPVPGTAAESSQPVGAAVDRATNRLVIVFTQRITLNPHVLSTGGSNPGASWTRENFPPMTTNGSGFNLGDDPNSGYWMVAANPQDDVVVRHSSQAGWDTLVGGKTKATPAIVVDDAGVPTIFVRGLDDRVHQARRVGGQWSTFGEWAPETIVGAPGVYRNRQEIVRVYAAMADRRIFFRAV